MVTELLFQLRRAQKIKIASRVEFYVPYSLGMDHHIVQIPQIDVGQLLAQNALHFRIQRLACLRINLASRPVD